MIGIVVDSNSQMSDELVRRYGIVVVPLTVTVDGTDHLEGVDLDADAFYGHWTDGNAPEVATSQPSPGRFLEAYRRLVDDGATEILSIHITAAMSGTLNSARLAADQVDVPVELVDTGTASFGISCCAWAAAEAVADGATLREAADVARRRSEALHTSFVVGVPALMERSGRAAGAGIGSASDDGVQVVAMTGSEISVLATVADLDAAVGAIVDDTLAWSPSSPDGLRVAIGTSDESSAPMSNALDDALSGHDLVHEVVRYRIGPSVGAHTGPGTSGLFVF